jgi:tetratricopeptide (TPR) repeat protein
MNRINIKLMLILAIALLIPLVGLSGCGSKNFSSGYELYKSSRYGEAVVEFAKSIELDPSQTEAYRYRGRCYIYTEQYDLAIADLNTAIGNDVKDSESYYYRGYCYIYTKQYDLAIADLNTAIRYDPNRATYYYYRGYAYMSNKLNNLAVADFNKVIQLSSDPTQVQQARELLNYLSGTQ